MLEILLDNMYIFLYIHGVSAQLSKSQNCISKRDLVALMTTF